MLMGLEYRGVRALAQLPLIDGEEVVFDGEGEDGEGGGVDFAALALFAAHAFPGAVLGLDGEEGIGDDFAGVGGVLAAALVHALGVVVAEIEEPALALAQAFLQQAIGGVNDLGDFVLTADLQREQAL